MYFSSNLMMTWMTVTVKLGMQFRSKNPMNVHRWRVLGGKDPTAMELIDKVNQLQKRLMSKTNVNYQKGYHYPR